MQVTDDLYIGRAIGPIGANQGVGPVARLYSYDVVPAASSTTNVAPLQTAAAGVELTVAAGAGTTRAFASSGAWRIVLDVARVVTLTSANNLSAVKFTVTGHDAYGTRLAQTLFGPNNGTVATAKAFKSVTSITADATATAVSAGTGNALGIPYTIADPGYVLQIGWAGAIGKDAGTLVVSDGAPATVYTGDVRGTYTPSSAPDGVKRLVFTAALSDAQAGPAAVREGLVGVDQSMVTMAGLSRNYLDGGFADSGYFQFFDAGQSAGGYSSAAVVGGTA